MTREIDALIAERIMGMGSQWTVQQQPDGAFTPTGEVWYSCPEFSTDISAAWLVVERLNAKLITVEITALVSVANRTTRYIVYSYNHETAMPREQAVEDSVALAICKVALKSVGVSL